MDPKRQYEIPGKIHSDLHRRWKGEWVQGLIGHISCNGGTAFLYSHFWDCNHPACRIRRHIL